jgi:beta-lactam-binding protein with PASTA domain
MRNLLRYLLLALVLLMVALVSALTAMRLAIHGREVTVPDLRGKTPAEARRVAEENGLGAQVESSYYSQSVPQGRVLSEMPPAGTLVRRGWEIRLALSLGPQRVVIPKLVGQSERAAGITIVERGLELGSTDRIQVPGANAGAVIGQDPAPNATQVSAPKMTLLVADEPAPEAFVMPSFVGQQLGAATATLRDTGFTLGKVVALEAPPGTTQNPAGQASSAQAPLSPSPANVPVPSPPPPASPSPAASPAPSSVIVSQEPGPGEKVYAGSAINFVVR